MFGSSLNNTDSVHILRSSGAQVGVSINWPVLLGEALCTSFEYGIINAHAGDLPRYRGNACPNWAIINNESNVGLCLHLMEANSLDSGPILMKKYYKLTQHTYIGDIYEWMGTMIPLMFSDLVDNIQDPKKGLELQQQSLHPGDWLRCYPRRPEDSKIDWQRDADYIHRLIRASSHPFQGAFTFLEGQQRLTVWRADIFQHTGEFLAMPGQVLQKIDTHLVIACGSGSLILTEYYLEANEMHPPLINLRSRLI